jgi:formyl-CoA transferase
MEVMAQRLLRAIGRGDMLDDPRYATNAARVAHRDEVDAIVGGWLVERPLKECLAFFEKEHITAAPVYDASQIVDDPHFKEREIVVEVEDEELGSVPMHNVTPRLSATPGGFRLPAPFVGQHNAALLEAAGFDTAEIDEMARRGVLWQKPKGEES